MVLCVDQIDGFIEFTITGKDISIKDALSNQKAASIKNEILECGSFTVDMNSTKMSVYPYSGEQHKGRRKVINRRCGYMIEMDVAGETIGWRTGSAETLNFEAMLKVANEN